MAISMRPRGWPSAGPGESRMSEHSITELLRHLLDELSTLFRQELSLARAELWPSLICLLAATITVAAGGALLFAGTLLLLFAAVLSLALVMPAWLAALSVAALVLVTGMLLLGFGLARIRGASLQPKRTLASLRKDKAVLARKRYG